MKLLTWNACRLLAGGRELALVNILTSSGADVATITECEIPEATREFSVAGYTTFSPTFHYFTRVVIHGDFNVDLDRVEDGTYYIATLAKSLAECTATAGLETHATPSTFRLYGNFIPHLGGDLSRPP
jgi:hypothetical protein